MAIVTRALMLYWAEIEGAGLDADKRSRERGTGRHPLPGLPFPFLCPTRAGSNMCLPTTNLTSLGWRSRRVQARVRGVSYANGEGSLMSLRGKPDWEERTWHLALRLGQHSLFSQLTFKCLSVSHLSRLWWTRTQGSYPCWDLHYNR